MIESGAAEYTDLLGCRWAKGGHDPHSGLDCLGVVAIILERLGLAPDRYAVLNYAPSLEYVEVGQSWKDATKPGDIFYACPPGGSPHVSILVRKKLALTASDESGVICQKPWAIQNLRCIYRVRRPAA